MKKPKQISALAVLISSLAGVPLAYAEAQSNRHSYANSDTSRNAFSFELHASDYSNATWAPDNEIAITVSTLRTLLPLSNHAKPLEKQHTKALQLQYKALISDKSFGIAASFNF